MNSTEHLIWNPEVDIELDNHQMDELNSLSLSDCESLHSRPNNEMKAHTYIILAFDVWDVV